MTRHPGVGRAGRKGRERVMRMQRARRLASVAVITTLAVTGLSACRSAPDVAVYFGSVSEISVAEVQRVFNDAKSKLTAAQGDPAARAGSSEPAQAPSVPITGPDVVSALVSRDVATRVAQQRNVSLPADLPLDEVAQSVGLPPDSEYVRIYAESRILFNLLLQGAQPAQAGDAELREVFEVFEATGAMQPGLTFEQFKGSVSPQAIETLGRATTVRKDVEAQLDQLNVRVNPRYEPAAIAIYSEPGPDNKPLSLVSVPLADADTSPVTDPA
jgi:hypothetical protein